MKQNFFKTSFDLLKENITVSQPLFVFFLVFIFLLKPIYTSSSNTINFWLSVVIACLAVCAFLAGWFGSIRYTVSLRYLNYDKNDFEKKRQNQANILQAFFPNVAEYFIPVSVLFVCYLIIMFSCYKIYTIYMTKLIGSIQISDELFKILNSGTTQEIQNYMANSMTEAEMINISAWFGGAIIVSLLVMFFVLWFAPALMYGSKNPLAAIKNAAMFLFKNIIPSFLIIFVMFSINIILSVMNVIAGTSILSFIPFLLYFFFITYYFLTVFVYYEQKTANNSNNRS